MDKIGKCPLFTRLYNLFLWGRQILEDIKVLDFGQAFFVPAATALLSHLGVEVIKIEPIEGDLTRLTAREGCDSASFLQNNVNKRSLAVNLRDNRGIEIILKLIEKVDVIVQNFRPGVMEKFGLDYTSVSKVNPRIIYCSAYMYGETGPLAHRRGGDPWAQAMTGIVGLQGSPDGPPYLAGPAVTDHVGGALCAFGITAALLIRERTGVGQEITLNLLNTGAFLQQPEISDYLVDGKLHKKVGRGFRGLFPFGAYKAKDGDVVTIFGQDDDEWPVVCSILGLEELMNDPRYDTQEKRVARKFELYPILDQAFSKKTRAEWQEVFRQHGLRCDPALDYAEFIDHPQFKENDMLIEVMHPRDGVLTLLGSPVKFKGIAKLVAKPPPILGEHTKEILSELGYTENDIDALKNEGVIGIASPEMMKRRPRTPSELRAPIQKGWRKEKGERGDDG